MSRIKECKNIYERHALHCAKCAPTGDLVAMMHSFEATLSSSATMEEQSLAVEQQQFEMDAGMGTALMQNFLIIPREIPHGTA
jgi:hypothetical protein